MARPPAPGSQFPKKSLWLETPSALGVVEEACLRETLDAARVVIAGDPEAK